MIYPIAKNLIVAVKWYLSRGPVLNALYTTLVVSVIAGIVFTAIGALSFVVGAFNAVLLVSEPEEFRAVAFDLPRLKIIGPRFGIFVPAAAGQPYVSSDKIVSPSPVSTATLAPTSSPVSDPFATSAPEG